MNVYNHTCSKGFVSVDPLIYLQPLFSYWGCESAALKGSWMIDVLCHLTWHLCSCMCMRSCVCVCVCDHMYGWFVSCLEVGEALWQYVRLEDTGRPSVMPYLTMCHFTLLFLWHNIPVAIFPCSFKGHLVEYPHVTEWIMWCKRGPGWKIYSSVT